MGIKEKMYALPSGIPLRNKLLDADCNRQLRLVKDLSGTLDGAGGVGGLLATEVGGVWYFPLYDNNGNVTDYVSETGEVVASYEYDAFGRTLSATGSMSSVFPFRFSTKYYDAETGLYYYGYRYYSPELGRWLTRDPIEEDGGDNLYAFCGNNGVSRIDARGLFCPFVDQWAQQVRNHLGMKDEKGAAFYAHEIYTLLAQGGVYYEPLAASLMSYWLKGGTKTYTIPSRHVYRAITDTRSSFNNPSPYTQHTNILCKSIKDCSPKDSINTLRFQLMASDGEYYHALGTFGVVFTGKYSCSHSGNCKFRGEWKLNDKYNWHSGKGANILGTWIEDDWAILMIKYYGASKEFDEEGSWRGSLTFSCGCGK